MSDNKPEIVGPHADLVEVEPIPDGTGFSGDGSQVEPVQSNESHEQKEPVFDPEFPFGRPENIKWSEIDAAGVELLKEINLRPWMKSTEYCSGHPLDRPENELSSLYPYVTGENVYQEIDKLDRAYLRGLINDTFFRSRKKELREAGATRFFLNVNIYNNDIYLEWIKLLAALVASATPNGLYPLIVRENPLRPGHNVSLIWDYWTSEERDMIHYLIMVSLNSFPV